MNVAAGTSEIAVIGAGVAGSTAALAAARLGCPVVLIDKGSGGRPDHGETLLPEAKQILLGLEAWEAFAALGSSPCRANRSAWGSDRLHTWDQLNSPHGHGWHVQRHRLETVLRDAAVDAGARLMMARLRDARRIDRSWRLSLDNGVRVSAKAILDATGRRAVLARKNGARRVQHDRLLGIAWWHPGTSDPATLVETVPTGWWYCAPSGDGMIAILFSDTDLLDWRAVHARPRELLADAPHTRARIAATGPAGPPAMVTASTSLLHPITGPGWIAIGDAAATYDPLAATGILRGMQTGRDAVTAILGATALDHERHERERFDDHLQQRRSHYRSEQRWPHTEFWRRRSRIRQAETALCQA